MPECTNHKLLPHPTKRPPPDDERRRPHAAIDPAIPPYAEVQVTTNFTFLTGASHPEEFVAAAVELGYRGLAITDTNTLAGVVRMHVAARAAGLPLAVGCRLELAATDAAPPLRLLVYPTTRAGYGRLCQLLTLGKRRAAKGSCWLELPDVLAHAQDWLVVAVPPQPGPGADAIDRVADDRFVQAAGRLRAVLPADDLSLAASCPYGADDRAGLARCARLAEQLGCALVASNAVACHAAARKPLHDVLACVRHGCTLETAGYLLEPNGERYLKPPDEMRRLFAEYPAALARSVELVTRAAAFSLDELRYEYPDETCPPGRAPMDYLTELVWRGAGQRYPDGVSAAIEKQIEHELGLIAELDYPAYFLTVYDLVTFARARGILCQGRGAAANSAVCFCLGVTSVDPSRISLLFERFVSKERDEPPDIDIDFEHERREEVIQYIYRKYGRERAALTAEVITYRARSAIRDVGKALGLSLDCVDQLARNREWFDPHTLSAGELRALGFDPDDSTMVRLRALVAQILGFPRHLSQHVGGFVMTRGPLCESVPIENAAMPDRTVIEWDKDDLDALGMLKVDVLGLGMLTCVRKALALVERHAGRRYELHEVPPEDPAVYDMICAADTVGVFQIESRAQMSMLPRLRPRSFYDLVIEVAIVRPGPIQGGMVHPYLRRRTGQEPVSFPSPAVEEVLQRTLGVPLFQEQAMALAIKAAGFTAGEADQLRRSMAAWKRKGHLIHSFGQKIVRGMLANGYEREFAERCFDQIKGFGEYGFPESHAASFALIVYVSAWLKRHHPAAFAAALINSQPMGFYAPAQIIRDARAHGVAVRPVDVNHSDWDCTLEAGGGEAGSGGGGEGGPVIRLGMRLVKGLGEEEARRLVEAVRRRGPFETVADLWRASDVPVRTLRALAQADAFGSLGCDRQRALWQTRGLRDESLPLFERLPAGFADDRASRLPPVAPARRVLHDYMATGLSLKAHPVAFLRPRLAQRGVTPNADLADPRQTPTGRHVAVAGMVLVRQRPSTASGLVFMTIEDETGVANLIVRPRVFERYRRAARHAGIILARGVVERDSISGQVVHVQVRSLHTFGRADSPLRHQQRNFH